MAELSIFLIAVNGLILSLLFVDKFRQITVFLGKKTSRYKRWEWGRRDNCYDRGLRNSGRAGNNIRGIVKNSIRNVRSRRIVRNGILRIAGIKNIFLTENLLDFTASPSKLFDYLVVFIVVLNLVIKSASKLSRQFVHELFFGYVKFHGNIIEFRDKVLERFPIALM
jgi:hypothetical protein